MLQWKRLGVLGVFGVLVIGAFSSAAYFASRPSGPARTTAAPASDPTVAASEPQGAHFVRVSPEQAQRAGKAYWHDRGMDDSPSAADAAAAASAAAQAVGSSANAESPPDDHRWYVLSMRTDECVLISDAFGVSTPHDVQKIFADHHTPIDTIKDEGGTADGAIVMLGDAEHPLLNPMAFVKGKGECIIALGLVQARAGAAPSG